MTLNRVLIVALFGVLVQQAFGQMNFGNFNPWGNNIGNTRFMQAPLVYYTCIGKNTNGDEMRITITDEEPQQQQSRWWTSASQGLHLNSFVRLGQQSNTQGTFQLILTTNSHVEDGCIGSVLGEIIDTRPQWNPWFQNGQQGESGKLGQAFTLSQMQRSYISDATLDDFNSVDQVNGRGMALCPLPGINGRICNGMIPLCCKCGRDTVNATTILQPIMQGGMQPGMQGGMMGGMQGGMTGMAGGMTGMTGGMTGGSLPGTMGMSTGSMQPNLLGGKKK